MKVDRHFCLAKGDFTPLWWSINLSSFRTDSVYKASMYTKMAAVPDLVCVMSHEKALHTQDGTEDQI